MATQPKSPINDAKFDGRGMSLATKEASLRVARNVELQFRILDRVRTNPQVANCVPPNKLACLMPLSDLCTFEKRPAS